MHGALAMAVLFFVFNSVKVFRSGLVSLHLQSWAVGEVTGW